METVHVFERINNGRLYLKCKECSGRTIQTKEAFVLGDLTAETEPWQRVKHRRNSMQRTGKQEKVRGDHSIQLRKEVPQHVEKVRGDHRIQSWKEVPQHVQELGRKHVHVPLK